VNSQKSGLQVTDEPIWRSYIATDFSILNNDLVPSILSVSNAIAALNIGNYQLLSQKGQANGYAPLNGSAVIDAAYLPSYVDDVLEFANLASFPVTGEIGKIYIALNTNNQYRWTGTVYVQITNSTAVWGNISGLIANQTDLVTYLSTNYGFTFSTGLTNTGNTITNNLLTGKAGGQVIIGGTGVADALTYKGTTGNGTLTAAAHIFTVGNNGATTAFQILNSGYSQFNNGTASLLIRERISLAGYAAIYLNSAATQAAMSGTSTATILNGQSSLTLQLGGSNYINVSSAQVQIDPNATTFLVSSANARFSGNAGFGTAANATALAQFGPSTASKSSTKFDTGVAPTTPNNGDLWHDSTEKCLMGNFAGVNQYDYRVLFVQTADKTVANSVAATSLFGTGIGTKTLPANFLTIGKTIEIEDFGYLGTTGSPQATFVLSIGAASITVVIPNVGTGLTSPEQYRLRVKATCRTLGTTGTISIQGELLYHASGTLASPPNLVEFISTADLTINTTISNIIDFTCQWGTADPLNSITSKNKTITILK
jgi:hypothetical protein